MNHVEFKTMSHAMTVCPLDTGVFFATNSFPKAAKKLAFKLSSNL